jgi:hypothetical protein
MWGQGKMWKILRKLGGYRWKDTGGKVDRAFESTRTCEKNHEQLDGPPKPIFIFIYFTLPSSG